MKNWEPFVPVKRVRTVQVIVDICISDKLTGTSVCH